MVSMVQHVSDFANLFKAFIGSNYLSMPFAFRESGLALGIALLLVIAVLTDHCCHLIVTCKQLIVRSLCQDERAAAIAASRESIGSPPAHAAAGPFEAEDSSTVDDDGGRADELHRLMTLGDIAQFTYGRPGLYLVNASLFVTQFGFCINYFIFIGNTLHQVLSLGQNETNEGVNDAADQLPAVQQLPPLWLLVGAPLPLFLGFALIRNIRSMGSVSVVANLSICAGVAAVLWVVLDNFEPSSSVVQARFATLPVYIGIVAVSYEGIGTVIPIEASMEENRRNFRGFLRGALLCVTGILGSVGAVGYLRHGADARQILVQNLPTQSVFVVVLDVALILGVLFTYPLQVYPVVQMVEQLCLARYAAPAVEENEALIMPPPSVQIAAGVARVPASPGSSAAPTWLRNCLRFAIVLCQLAMAVLLRNLYAYVSSFIGALGSIFLAFVLPCAAHLRLTWDRPDASRLVMAKDACVCCLGCLASATSLFVTVAKIAAPNFFD